MQNYYDISPIKALLKAAQVLEEKEIENPYLSCDIIGISVYKDEALTFLVKLEDGEVFSYIPITALFWKEKKKKFYKLDELVYTNSPSDGIRISEVESLKGDVTCYFKERNQWKKGTYLFTIDFYEDNELLNFVKLQNGHFAFCPFHKMKFKAKNDIEKSFKPYKKQRETYVVKK